MILKQNKIKEAITNLVVTKEADIKNLLIKEIEPVLFELSTLYVLYESNLERITSDQQKYHNYWCQLTKNRFCVYKDEYSSKNFSKPLIRISVD